MSGDTHPRLRPKRGPVVILVLLLIGLGAGGVFLYRQRVAARRVERIVALQSALSQIRAAIGAHEQRSGRRPPTLEALVAAGDLRAIPIDPITGSNTTWRVIKEESVVIDDSFRGGAKDRKNSPPVVTEVRSGAPGRDDYGKPWSEY